VIRTNATADAAVNAKPDAMDDTRRGTDANQR
jgi:hypothetical protein